MAITDETVTWFHGLITERTAEFCPDATQVPFFQREIALFGTLPEPWPGEGRRRIAADGSEYVEQQRMLSVDPLEQKMVRQVRIEKRVAGELIGSQEYTQHRILYLPNEVLLMLRIAGFREITVQGDYADEPATPDSEPLVFPALK